MKHQLAIVIDFGGRYNQLITRRVGDLNVHREVIPYKKALNAIREKQPIGITFTDGPNSVYEENSPQIEKEIFELNIPILEMCYGIQLISKDFSGVAEKTENHEFGKTNAKISNQSSILKGMSDESIMWMSHTDFVSKKPEGFDITQTTNSCPVAAITSEDKKIFVAQYHPEVNHTVEDRTLVENLLYEICKAGGDWTMENFLEEQIQRIRKTIDDKKVLLALLGGVDSSACASFLSKAIGKNLIYVFVDRGLIRKNEGDEAEAAFKNDELNFVRVNIKDRFLDKLKGVSDPERKRKIIGKEFIRVFEDEAKKIESADFLAQGTIYPDAIEPGQDDVSVVESHHNVGGLPDVTDFKDLIKPLRDLFKDEVRGLGLELEMPEYLVYRQPFPRPGLGIRVVGEITEEKLEVLREAGFIFRDEVVKAEIDKDTNQYFAVITNNRTVGVIGDFRTHDYTSALGAATTADFMTADRARIPYGVLDKTSVRIINEVDHINRIVYDITNKPPAAIEWE